MSIATLEHVLYRIIIYETLIKSFNLTEGYTDLV